ncbi:hypothetical protein OH77DRAFT_536728 [Trametes cingulata]|nr:hypothetical protein OH77DRAFT_536728 [Trametes cingulata]
MAPVRTLIFSVTRILTSWYCGVRADQMCLRMESSMLLSAARKLVETLRALFRLRARPLRTRLPEMSSLSSTDHLRGCRLSSIKAGRNLPIQH